MENSRKDQQCIPSEKIGDSDVWILPGPSGVARFRLPLPPLDGGKRQYGERASIDLESIGSYVGYYLNSPALRVAWKRFSDVPISGYTKINFKFFLGNMGYDIHDGIRRAVDFLQTSGVVLSSRHILPQVDTPENSPGDPRLIISIHP